jgi:hypothetical protein
MEICPLLVVYRCNIFKIIVCDKEVAILVMYLHKCKQEIKNLGLMGTQK